MNENEPTNNQENQVDTSYVDMAEGKPTVMQAVKAAQESGDSIAITQAQEAADEAYAVHPKEVESIPAYGVETESKSEAVLTNTLRSLRVEENEVEKAYRENPLWKSLQPKLDVINALNEKLRSAKTIEESASLREQIEVKQKECAEEKAQAARLSEEIDQARSNFSLKINEAQDKLKEIQIDKTEAEVNAYVTANPGKRNLDEVTEFSKRKPWSGEGNYSSSDELMSDVHVVLSSGLKNEEKASLIKALSSQITSSTIGDSRSNLLARYVERLSV